MTVDTRQREFQESLRNVVDATGLTLRPSLAPCYTIGVTSPSYGEGKTTVAMAVAGLLSSDLDVEVALVDTDFETHSLGDEYHLDTSNGIADVLAGRTTMDAVMHRVPGTRLHVVTSGALPPDSGHLVRSGELAQFIDFLKERYPYVVLDLPGMLTSSSGRAVADLCDGVIVVSRTGVTTRVELDETLERLTQVKVLGIVINNWRSRIPRWLERGLGLSA